MFNGLYGQDAHEYLRLSQAYYDKLQGLEYIPQSLGDVYFASGYPFFGALLRCLLPFLSPVLALQLVSLLSYLGAIYFFEKNCALLTPGTKWQTRRLFSVILFALCPILLKAGLIVMSDGTALCMALAALWFSLRFLDGRKGSDAAIGLILMAFAVFVRYALLPLFVPILAVLLLKMLRIEYLKWLLCAALGISGLLMLHFWLKAGIPKGTLEHPLLGSWTLLNFFKLSCQIKIGPLDFWLPNFVYLLYPICHFGFFLPTPLLFLAGKRTDYYLFSKKIILSALFCQALFLGGIPVPIQSIRYLLPEYALLLLLLFPAWDRFIVYGFYFLDKKWMRLALVVFVILQIIGAFFMIRPIMERNRLELQSAAILRENLPPKSIVYAFDLDNSMKSYLKTIEFRNMWERRYSTDFRTGEFVLFNEPHLRQQWQGQNPILNWDELQARFVLDTAATLPDGWFLFKIWKEK